ncbi:unnamed protein product [Allacma fusca]|uniref:G domain-containing protein n=1 Tax=Allacma fusca TaxID=39272 RepID=A0A8J2PD95_9HEXA|nr:unnamed protein product [Allacma fusca]
MSRINIVPVFFLLVCGITVSFPSPIHGSNQVNQKNVDAIVDETERLIVAGESITQLDDTKRDIVLMIGNTGAGKTTITKFLTEVGKLESYDTGDRYLIRDTDQKISVGSTMVSKTIFPELFVDGATGTAFYDLPGFSDTRSTSIEIANAVFMKKVADHAHRVKLLFVVNYGSLRTGETRTDLKTFLEQAVDLVKSPAKFKSAIAIVATKVEVRRNRDQIIRGIASYLLTARANLEEVFHDVNKRRAAQDLIDAFLSKDGSGKYNRISYFKQPDNVGPLTRFPEVMSQKAHIETVLYRNTQFLAKSPEDFGFSVSSGAKLVITKLAERLNDRTTVTMATLGNRLASQLSTKVQTSNWSSLGSLIEEPKKLGEMAQSLASTKSLEAFKESLNKIIVHLKLTDVMADELKDLERKYSILKFLAQISGSTFSASILDWSQPIQISVSSFAASVSQKLANFGMEMESKVSAITQQINTNFVKKLQSFANAKEKQQLYLTFSNALKTAYDRLLSANSVNSFIQQVKNQMNILDKEVPTTTLEQLTKDINFDKSLPFKLLMWASPFEALLMKIKEGKYNMDLQVLQDDNTMTKANNKAVIDELNNRYQKDIKDHEKTLANLRNTITTDQQRWDAERAQMIKNHQEYMNKTDKLIKDLQARKSQKTGDGGNAAGLVWSILDGVSRIIGAATKRIRSSPVSTAIENMMTDELMRRRLLIDGEGGGDDRRALLLQRGFLSFCMEKPGEEMKSSQKKLVREMGQLEHVQLKTRFAIKANEEFREIYKDLAGRFAIEIEKTREELDSYRNTLDLAKENRKQQQEYSSLVKLIRMQPDRKKTELKKLKLESELAELEAQQKSIEDSLANRKRSMTVLMTAISSLYGLVNEEEEESRMKEEAARQAAEENLLKQLAEASMLAKSRHHFPPMEMDKSHTLVPNSNPGSPLEQVTPEGPVTDPRPFGFASDVLMSPMDPVKERYDELSESD